MDINPTGANGPRPNDPGALEAARAQEARRANNPADPKKPAPPESERADSVDVSSESKSLAQQSGVREARSSLPPERLKEIGERLASGFYDQPAVIERLTRRLEHHPDLKDPSGA